MRPVRVGVWIGVAALSLAAGWPAHAQQTNRPLYEPSPALAPPGWPAWQGANEGQATLAPPYMPPYFQPGMPSSMPPYLPPARYPTDGRNLMLDNRAPTLWPVAPGLGDATPRLGSALEQGAPGTGVRRPDGVRSPARPETGRPSWR